MRGQRVWPPLMLATRVLLDYMRTAALPDADRRALLDALDAVPRGEAERRNNESSGEGMKHLLAYRTERDRLLRLLYRHAHTDACLRYAATTGKPSCIAECAEERMRAVRDAIECDAERDEGRPALSGDASGGES